MSKQSSRECVPEEQLTALSAGSKEQEQQGPAHG